MSCGSVKPAHWTTDQSDCGNECFHLSRQSSWVNDFGWMISLITCLSFALHLILFFFFPLSGLSCFMARLIFLCVSQFSVRVSITFSNLDSSTCQLTSRFLPWQVPCKLIFLFTDIISWTLSIPSGVVYLMHKFRELNALPSSGDS
jgi:hypothetical protein